MQRTTYTLVCCALAQAGLFAQAPSWETNGSLTASWHGFRLAVVGDYNGNGTDDVLIGEPGDLGANFVVGGGSAMVRDGDGSCITIFYGQATRRMGTGVSRLPDINGDGVGEILIGSPGYAAFGTVWNGRVELFFGGRDGGGAPGCAGAAGTTPDLLIDRGVVGGTQINGDGFGVEIEPLGDMDGDGLADFAIGAPNGNLDQIYGNDRGYVQVYSSSLAFGGAVVPLYTIDGYRNNSRFGTAIAGIGDVTGDGIEDLAIGAADESWGGNAFQGRVRFFDGATGTLFLRLNGQNGHRLGFAVENAGDVDGDGLDDVAIGAIGDRPAGATAATGSVTVVPGSYVAAAAAVLGTGAVIAQNMNGITNVYKLYGDDLYRSVGFSTFADAFGAAIANVGDIDGDAVDDLLIGAPGSPIWDPDAQIFGNWPSWIDAVNTGMARLVSGQQGFAIKQYFSPVSMAADNFGAAVAGGGDFDMDGQPDFVIAAPWEDQGPVDSGHVRAYSGITEFGIVYATGNPNSTGTNGKIAARGVQSVAGNGLRFDMSDLPAGQNGLVLFGPDQISPGIQIGDGLLFIGGPLYRVGVVTVSPFGTASYPVDMTVPPAAGVILPLTRWNFQLWHRDTTAGGVNLTDAITVGFY